MAAEDYNANQNIQFVDSAGSTVREWIENLSLQILCHNLYLFLSALQQQLR